MINFKMYLNLIFNPFKGVNYFDGYFYHVEQIRYHKRFDLILQIKFLIVILLLKGFHYSYIGYQNSLTYIERILVIYHKQLTMMIIYI